MAHQQPTTIAAGLALLVALGVVVHSTKGQAMQSPDSAAAPTTAPLAPLAAGRVVLQDVPRIGYDIRICPFPGAVEGYLKYTGAEPDIALIQCASGAAFRRFYNKEDGGNVDLMYLGSAVWDRTFAALGYEYKHVSPADRTQLVETIKQSIAADRPLISFGIVGPPEAGLITGYDKGGDVLIGWSYFQENKSRYYEQANWQPCVKQGLGVIVVGERKPALSERDALILILRTAIDLERTPKRPGHPDHVTGLAAYEAWAKDLENDADFPDNGQVLETRKMILGDQLCMLADRGSAADYFERVADSYPQAAEDLHAAAALYHQTASLGGQIERGVWGNTQMLIDGKRRRQMAADIRKAMATETAAVEQLEKALEILGDAQPKAPGQN